MRLKSKIILKSNLTDWITYHIYIIHAHLEILTTPLIIRRGNRVRRKPINCRKRRPYVAVEFRKINWYRYIIIIVVVFYFSWKTSTTQRLYMCVSHVNRRPRHALVTRYDYITECDNENVMPSSRLLLSIYLYTYVHTGSSNERCFIYFTKKSLCFWLLLYGSHSI